VILVPSGDQLGRPLFTPLAVMAILPEPSGFLAQEIGMPLAEPQFFRAYNVMTD
jgi:hypothetical protein